MLGLQSDGWSGWRCLLDESDTGSLWATRLGLDPSLSLPLRASNAVVSIKSDQTVDEVNEEIFPAVTFPKPEEKLCPIISELSV